MRIIFLITLLFCFSAFHEIRAEGKAKHIVLVVWDGMRPDFVNESNTPALYELVRHGVFFQNHHAAFLSSTEVNGVVLATGVHPNRSGVIANVEYRPDIQMNRAIGTESLEAIRKGDRLTGGNYLSAPTFSEILHLHGLRTVLAGCKPISILHDRAERSDDSANIVLFEGRTLPGNVQPVLTNLFGAFPPLSGPRKNRDLWTTRAVVGPLWEKGVPPFTLLWLAEPDASQHGSSPGSARSLEAIRASDDHLALLIAALKEKNVYETTDILLVSDHGFSTVSRTVDVAGRLRKNGINATRDFKSPPAKGDVLVVGNGGAVLIYVVGHDKPTIRRVVEFLQTQDFAGPIFTRTRERGTFPLSAGFIDAGNAADIVFSMRWTEDINPSGVAGHVVGDGGSESMPRGNSRTGTHVTLSRFDMRNTLVAAGPDFRSGFVDELPSGNVDVAPTILHIFGIKPPQPMDGRVLTEALTIKGPKVGKPKTKILEAKNDSWRQYLKRTELNGVIYLDEGNAGVAKP